MRVFFIDLSSFGNYSIYNFIYNNILHISVNMPIIEFRFDTYLQLDFELQMYEKLCAT